MWSWVTRNRGSVELVALSAGVVTVNWLVKRYYVRDTEEEPELSELEPIKEGKDSTICPDRWDSDVLCPPPANADPSLQRLTSFKVESLPSEVSCSEMASRASIDTAVLEEDVVSEASSDDSLFVPESQMCTRELLLMKHDAVPSLQTHVATVPSVWSSMCCCWSRKTHPLPAVSEYRTKPASLFLVSEDDDLYY